MACGLHLRRVAPHRTRARAPARREAPATRGAAAESAGGSAGGGVVVMTGSAVLLGAAVGTAAGVVGGSAVELVSTCTYCNRRTSHIFNVKDSKISDTTAKKKPNNTEGCDGHLKTS